MGTLGSKGLRVPNEKNRMAQIINEKVKTLCNSKGLKFVKHLGFIQRQWESLQY